MRSCPSSPQKKRGKKKKNAMMDNGTEFLSVMSGNCFLAWVQIFMLAYRFRGMNLKGAT